MAIATSSNYYSNAIVGSMSVGADVNVLDRHTSPKYVVGLGFIRADGNKFRYVHYGAAVAGNVVVGCSNTNNNLTSVNGKVVATATAVAISGEKIIPGAAGSRYLEVVLATAANNQFAGGYLVITKDTGVGFTYRIRGNTATDTPATGNIRIELYEPLKLGLDNTSDIAIAASKWVDLDEAPAMGTTYNLVGVSMAAASADNWGWVCTRGVCGCLTSDAAAAGTKVVLTNGTAAGAVRALTDNAVVTATNLTNSPIIGYVVVPGVAGQQAIIDVQLE